jgi:hypothetical protein
MPSEWSKFKLSYKNTNLSGSKFPLIKQSSEQWKCKRDSRFPRRCERGIGTSGTLLSIERQLVTNVSLQPLSPICKGQTVPQKTWTLKMGLIAYTEMSVTNWH